MNKLKWALRLITVCCIALPLIFTVLSYKDNLLGIIVPSQIMGAMSGQSSMKEVLPDLKISDLQPTYNNDFQFDSNTNSFTVSFNVTNPLNNSITINKISFDVTYDNGTALGTIELDHPVTLLPGENSTIPIAGGLSQDFVNFLQENGVDLSNLNFNSENMGDLDINPSDLRVTNLSLDIGGVQVQMNEFDIGNLGGLFGSGNGEP